MTELEIRRLASEIRGELSALAEVRTLLEEARVQFAQRAPGPLELGGIALNLHAFYNGVENLFRRVALELGEGLPWRRGLAFPIAQKYGPGDTTTQTQGDQ